MEKFTDAELIAELVNRVGVESSVKMLKPDAVLLALCQAVTQIQQFDRETSNLIEERDNYFDRLDTLARATGDVGEWNNNNECDDRALENIESMQKRIQELIQHLADFELIGHHKGCPSKKTGVCFCMDVKYQTVDCWRKKSRELMALKDGQ